MAKKSPVYYSSNHRTVYQAMVKLIKSGGFSELEADIIINMAAKEDPDSEASQFIRSAKNYRCSDCDSVTLAGIDGALYRAGLAYKASLAKPDTSNLVVTPIYQ
jgi:hypothetical protein